MFDKITKTQFIILGIVLGLCLIISSKVISKSISKNEVTVTGSAFEYVTSDSAKWNFVIRATNSNRIQAYKKLEADTPIVVDFLTKNSIKKEEIEVLSTNTWEEYNYQNGSRGEVARYVFEKTISVSSKDVNLIKETALKTGELVEKGVTINGTSPQYFYSKIAEKKPTLLEAATKDAKVRAEGILSATNNKVGKIRSARMGVFQITPADSNEVADWGINDSTTIEKKITAVANVVFSIK